jgi:hypothetical protein
MPARVRTPQPRAPVQNTSRGRVTPLCVTRVPHAAPHAQAPLHSTTGNAYARSSSPLAS